ncbi:hypothetical protein Hanom_Chr03g00207361 [Helianthus anomalus]
MTHVVYTLCNVFSHQPTNLKVSGGPSYGLNTLQSANHKDHPCTFSKSWGLNTLQSTNHQNHPFTFGRLRIKSKIIKKQLKCNYWYEQ